MPSNELDEIRRKLKFYENLVKSLPGNVYWKDKSGVYLGCNQTQADAIGRKSPEEIIGKTDFELSTEKEARVLRENDIHVMTTGERQILEESSFKEGGKVLTYLSQKIPLKDDDGKTIGILGISFDITSRKTAEMNLKEEQLQTQQALDNIIANMPGHVYWKDRNLTFRGCNYLQAKSAGFDSIEDMIGKSDYEMPWKDQADILREHDLEVMEKGTPQSVMEPSKLADGKEAIFLTQKVPLKDLDGNIVGILGISFDVTAKQEAEQLKTEKEIIEKRSETMRLLATSIAHELRTPLRSIRAGADGLEINLQKLITGYRAAKEAGIDIPYINPHDNKHMDKVITNLQHETDQAIQIIDKLLMNTNNLGFDSSQFKTISIDNCIYSAIRRYQKHDNFKLIHSDNEDFEFRGDPLLMQHVIMNLINNSFYYITAAGKGEIFISTKKGKDKNYLVFKDTGKGIPAQDLPNIFQQFFTRTPGSTGIGLAFCKLIIQSFNGDITCDSVEGEYTEFKIELPKI